MEQINEKKELGAYNTAINVIGSLRDSGIIIKAISSYFDQADSTEEFFKQRNEYNLRTERSRDRIEREVRKVFLHFENDDHHELFHGIFKDEVPLKDKELALLWQFVLNNRLFREISSEVFAKLYTTGRTVITKDDITAYLKEFILNKESMQASWSENTTNTIATKYLNFMSKIGFVSPGKIKSFQHIRPSSEAQVLFLYFAQLFAPANKNILVNELLPVSFIPSEEIVERFKKFSIKGFFNMDYNGVALNIELIHSYKGVCNVLYN